MVQMELGHPSTALAWCASGGPWVFELQPGHDPRAVVVAGAAGRVQIELARPLRLRVDVARVGVQHFSTLDAELVGDGGALRGAAGWRWSVTAAVPTAIVREQELSSTAPQHTPALC